MDRKILVLLLLATFWITQADGGSQAKMKTTAAQIVSLQQAITDEIYDYDYEGGYFPEGGPIGSAVSDSVTRVPMYICPSIRNGDGEVIYKLMPYGEVYRHFHVRQNGMIVLDGDPEIGFPATQPDRKTIYYEDDEVIHMKSTWIKSSFEVRLNPSQGDLQVAIQRQKERNNGFSAWEAAHPKSK